MGQWISSYITDGWDYGIETAQLKSYGNPPKVLIEIETNFPVIQGSL